MSKKIYIENCEYSVEYECPLEWKNLKKTKDSKVRFCGECNKEVYRCRTEEDLDKHIDLNHCIAINNSELGVVGMMKPPRPTPPEDLE